MKALTTQVYINIQTDKSYRMIENEVVDLLKTNGYNIVDSDSYGSYSLLEGLIKLIDKFRKKKISK